MRAWSSHRPQDADGRPLLVLLHGRGAGEDSLALLAGDLPAELVVAAPRGPLPEGQGAAWFEMHAIGYPVAASLARTRRRLLAWLDQTWGPDRDVALLGFSDGALLAGDLLLTAPQRFGAGVLLGGALPWSTPLPAEDGRLAGVRVLHSYGDEDPVVPRDLLDRTADWLTTRSGADVEVDVEAGLAHAVSTAQVARARRTLEEWLHGAP